MFLLFLQLFLLSGIRALLVIILIAIAKFYIRLFFQRKETSESSESGSFTLPHNEMDDAVLYQKLEKRNDGFGYNYFLTTDENLPDFTPVNHDWLRVLKLLAISELDDNECTQQTLQNIRELLTVCFSNERKKFNLVIQELKRLHDANEMEEESMFSETS
jgi:hypothetical protein